MADENGADQGQAAPPQTAPATMAPVAASVTVAAVATVASMAPVAPVAAVAPAAPAAPAGTATDINAPAAGVAHPGAGAGSVVPTAVAAALRPHVPTASRPPTQYLAFRFGAVRTHRPPQAGALVHNPPFRFGSTLTQGASLAEALVAGRQFNTVLPQVPEELGLQGTGSQANIGPSTGTRPQFGSQGLGDLRRSSKPPQSVHAGGQPNKERASRASGSRSGQTPPSRRSEDPYPINQLSEHSLPALHTLSLSDNTPPHLDKPAPSHSPMKEKSKMVGKKSKQALKREEGMWSSLTPAMATLSSTGLARTDNNLPQTTWPQPPTLNQKNYYTEYLKRDEQALSLRLLQEERRNRLTAQALAKERARAQGRADGDEGEGDGDMDVDADDDAALEDSAAGGSDLSGSKVIVIHVGSENLRIGLASDPLPKSVPMVIARPASFSEANMPGSQPEPKRAKQADGSPARPEEMFGAEWSKNFGKACGDLKQRMRANKRKLMPNSKELVVNFNSRVAPDQISEHNDPLRIEWTETAAAPAFITGHEALRIPDESKPRYRLFWPIQHGWYNEAAYLTQQALSEDVTAIIEDAIKRQLGLAKKRDWAQYAVVYLVPDWYERAYVTQTLDMLMRDLGFGRVTFVQESVAATFGGGVTTACVVDVGAQKTSVACVEEGMVLEGSRVNVKLGGADVTRAFVQMMLFDHFPYADLDLRRRYDWLLAEELKQRCCTAHEESVAVVLHDFHVRAPGADTRRYEFKTYDEVLLAVAALFDPAALLDHAGKLRGRRSLVRASRDLYNDDLDDPISAAQNDVVGEAATPARKAQGAAAAAAAPAFRPPPGAQRLGADGDLPASAVGSPAPEGDGTPAPAGGNGLAPVPAAAPKTPLQPCQWDDVLPVAPLHHCVLAAVAHASRAEARRARDFLGSVLVVGGGSMTPGLRAMLEARLKAAQPPLAGAVLVGGPPRDLDPRAAAWKGGAIFAKLPSTQELWIGRLEYDRLGARTLAYKLLWHWLN